MHTQWCLHAVTGHTSPPAAGSVPGLSPGTVCLSVLSSFPTAPLSPRCHKNTSGFVPLHTGDLKEREFWRAGSPLPPQKTKTNNKIKVIIKKSHTPQAKIHIYTFSSVLQLPALLHRGISCTYIYIHTNTHAQKQQNCQVKKKKK